MDDDGPFAAWFEQWKPSRPEMTPIGWYVSEDLKAAFNAGREAEASRYLGDIED